MKGFQSEVGAICIDLKGFYLTHFATFCNFLAYFVPLCAFLIKQTPWQIPQKSTNYPAEANISLKFNGYNYLVGYQIDPSCCYCHSEIVDRQHF